jgi:hypothetical protein
MADPPSPGLGTAGPPDDGDEDDAGVIPAGGEDDLAMDEDALEGEDEELDDELEDEIDDEELDDEPEPVTAKKPVDPKADLEARRAATKARMEAGEKPKRRAPAPAGAGENSAKPKGTATATASAGTRARRGAAPKKTASSAKSGRASAADPTGTKAKRDAKEVAEAKPKSVPRPSKRTGSDAKAARTAAARSGDPKKAAKAAESSRYTAPIPRSQMESPTWVPVLMFTLLGVGGLLVLLTYVVWNARPLTLGIGLVLILGGILTATQYR